MDESLISEPAIKIMAMPKDANADGDIFGGWVLSMMDLAGGITARKLAHSRVVTVAVNDMEFHKPVVVGDCLKCYASLKGIGNSSITMHVEAHVERFSDGSEEKVTEGTFVYVAINKDRKPVKVKR